ncbi:hypothetical protein [Iningainema tapete]|uniref:Uncharacterized protein n=1 Tax=Iningainema tapete BLCC-T55 TaxID=2748662 RepID=A0A8J6XMS6_9CYAN|nr:hypothetical protein [Iningainema tapete]MBD2773856.1 hypothetical protein [Iningainema tapete BLCC-T55]
MLSRAALPLDEAEPQGRHSHAERGNEGRGAWERGAQSVGTRERGNTDRLQWGWWW